MKQVLPNMDQNNETILKDACTLLKSDFINLYKEIGYDSSKTGICWHTLRASSKGRELLEKNKLLQNNSVYILNDLTTEAIVRKTKLLNLNKEKMNNVEEKVADNLVEVTVSENKTDKAKKGDKKKKIHELLKSGVTDYNVIMDKVGASKLYVQSVIKRFK